ncbi:hypothetical protein [Kribbella sp. NPDC048928]
MTTGDRILFSIGELPLRRAVPRMVARRGTRPEELRLVHRPAKLSDVE